MPCLIMGPRFPKVDPALAHATGQLVVWTSGVDHLVRKQRFVIGSDPTCDLRLEGTEVEPTHALIEVIDGAHSIVDLGSASGVVWNGTRITRKRIDAGDEVMIGRHRLVLRFV
jgi:pSer/pThr/pTyr-binding forkhead associated (FHA) protein